MNGRVVLKGSGGSQSPPWRLPLTLSYTINWLPADPVASSASSYILNSRRRIHFELSLTFAQEVLNSSKIFLVKANAFLKLGPADATNYQHGSSKLQV